MTDYADLIAQLRDPKTQDSISCRFAADAIETLVRDRDFYKENCTIWRSEWNKLRTTLHHVECGLAAAEEEVAQLKAAKNAALSTAYEEGWLDRGKTMKESCN